MTAGLDRFCMGRFQTQKSLTPVSKKKFLSLARKHGPKPTLNQTNPKPTLDYSSGNAYPYPFWSIFLTYNFFELLDQARWSIGPKKVAFGP
jgi:hypothetical protein